MRQRRATQEAGRHRPVAIARIAMSLLMPEKQCCDPQQSICNETRRQKLHVRSVFVLLTRCQPQRWCMCCRHHLNYVTGTSPGTARLDRLAALAAALLSGTGDGMTQRTPPKEGTAGSRIDVRITTAVM